MACSAPDQEATLAFGTGEAASLSVPGIPGPYCAYGAEKHLLEHPVVGRVELDWERERIVVFPLADRSLDADDLRRAMERADYPYRYTIETAVE